MPDENKPNLLQRTGSKLNFNQKKSTIQEIEKDVNRFLKRTKRYGNKSKTNQKALKHHFEESSSLQKKLINFISNQIPQNGQITRDNPRYKGGVDPNTNIELSFGEASRIGILLGKVTERKQEIEHHIDKLEMNLGHKILDRKLKSPPKNGKRTPPTPPGRHPERKIKLSEFFKSKNRAPIAPPPPPAPRKVHDSGLFPPPHTENQNKTKSKSKKKAPIPSLRPKPLEKEIDLLKFLEAKNSKDNKGTKKSKNGIPPKPPQRTKKKPPPRLPLRY